MGFGNVDPIDTRHRARIRELEDALAQAAAWLGNGASMTQREKEEGVAHINRVLGDRPARPPISPGAFCS